MCENNIHVFMSAQTHNMEDKYKVRHVGLKTSPDSVKIDYLVPVSVTADQFRKSRTKLSVFTSSWIFKVSQIKYEWISSYVWRGIMLN